MTKWALAFGLTILAAHTAVAEAKRYSADRFDTRLEVLHGGSMRVVETVVVRFDSGTFTQFYRVIPTRNTDGIEIESAALDGQVLPAGKDVDHVDVVRGDRIRITWHFAPTANGSHRFDLTYLVHGVVRQQPDADVLTWRSLPTEHQYAIRGSTVDLFLPVTPIAAPAAVLHRAADSTFTLEGTHTRIAVSDIRRNGWIQAEARMPRGSVLDAPPAWQQRETAARAFGRYWITAAASIVLIGLAVLLAVRQGYEQPFAADGPMTSGSTPPDTLPAALAGPLVTNGSIRLEQGMAALFTLADRGALAIEERPRSLGHRNFVITRTSTAGTLEPYEQALLDIALGGDAAATVGLAKGRGRVVRLFRRFSEPLRTAMRSAGLLDERRRAVRRRFRVVAATAMTLAAISPLALPALHDRFGSWPLLVSAALAIVGITALVFYAAHTPLSDEGLRRAQQWRAFRQYLRNVARDREPSPPDDDARRLLPYVVALGLAPAWAAYLKRHRAAAPAWFHAMDARGDQAVAFATLVAIGGAGTGGGAHGAGGAAGGGASGAS